MASNWKDLLRPYIPSKVLRARRALWGWKWFRGNYSTWTEAKPHAIGYDEPAILARVLEATLAVQAGKAAYERDSVLFTTPAVEEPLLNCLRLIATRNEGRLRVLDFGGSLGTTYWQHRHALAGLQELRWDVVEQAHFVTAGRQHLESESLRFYATMAEAQAATPHDVLLASGVVHCLPDPHALVEDMLAQGIPHLLFHNLPLHDTKPDYVMIEHVPPEIYEASYPVWFLNRERFLAHFQGRYQLLETYPSTAVWDRGWFDYPSTGLLLGRSP